MAAIALRGGQKTNDRRLDRIRQFDERSRLFPIRKLISTVAKPRSYTWSVPNGLFLNQFNEGACFPAGTQVLLADGSWKSIEHVPLLTEVVTAEGHIGRVLQTMVRSFKGQMISVRLHGHNHFRSTDEHPILTKRGYVPAKELKIGDYVALPKFLSNTATHIHLRKIVTDKTRQRFGTIYTGGRMSDSQPLPEEIALTPAFGRLLGLYAAEGMTTPNKVVWCFGRHEEATLVKETIGLIKEVFGVEARIQYRPNNAIYVNLYGRCWHLLFTQLIPGTSKHGDKYLSHHVTSGPRDYLEQIFFGWLSGDGYARRNSHEGVTVSHCLALNMFSIANGLGLRPAVHVAAPTRNRHAVHRQPRWSVCIAKGDGANSAKQTDVAVWRKVTAIICENFVGHVFNLHVEGDESYVAEGFGVHNCTGFAVAHEAAARPVLVKNISNQIAKDIYHRARQLDEWPGENYDGSSVLAAMKAGQEKKWYEEYRWGFSLLDLILAVGYKGPVVIGVNWYTQMMDADANGFIHVDGEIEGGHATLVRGVRITNLNPLDGIGRIRNSWGSDWGQNGDCFISFKDLDRLLHEEGEVAIPVKRKLGV